MYYKNDEHQKRALAMKSKAGQGNDCEYCSAIYVLAALDKSVEKHVQLGGIKFLGLFKDAEVWSSSERSLLRLAATLFNASTWPVSVEDVFYSLDEENTRVALQALEIRYLMR